MSSGEIDDSIALFNASEALGGVAVVAVHPGNLRRQNYLFANRGKSQGVFQEFLLENITSPRTCMNVCM